jgi:HK97 family phage major capsid protein
MADIEVTDELKGKSAREVAQILKAKSDAHFEKFKDKVTQGDNGPTFKFDDPIKDIETYRKGHDELAVIGEYYDAVLATEQVEAKNRSRMEQILTQPVNRPGFTPDGKSREDRQFKTIGELFTNSERYQELKAARRLDTNEMWSVSLDDFDFKTTMTTAAGFAPANDRTNIVIPYATEEPTIQNFIPAVTTDLDSIKFMDETTFTNAGDNIAENAALQESAIAYTERSQPVENVGHFLPVTEQQLEIAEGVESLLNDRLMLQYKQVEQTKLLTGTGSTPQLQGYYTKSGLQTQAKGSDPGPTAIYKAMTKVRWTGFAEPDLTVWHPNDWQDIRILQDANGNYIWGNPSQEGPDRIWGKPVVQTTAATENSPMTGAFRMYSQIWRKRGARIEVGLQNDDFVKMKKTIRVYGRLALVIYRGAAYCKTTGM